MLYGETLQNEAIFCKNFTTYSYIYSIYTLYITPYLFTIYNSCNIVTLVFRALIYRRLRRYKWRYKWRYKKNFYILTNSA